MKNNKAKAKSKPKVIAKKRGYYYSSANINKRKEQQQNQQFTDNNINENNTTNYEGEDFLVQKSKTPLRNNNQNKNNKNMNNNNNNNYDIGNNQNSFNPNKYILESYSKNNLLLNFIENEHIEYDIILDKLKKINCSLGKIILKPKIKNNEINKKLIRDQEKKEKEEIDFNKNISDKIDEALNRANLALDNIRYLGKQKVNPPSNRMPTMDQQPQIINRNNNLNDLKKEKEKMNLINLAQKCNEKYVDNIQINKQNHDEYFYTISKNRKLIKDAKEQLQSCRFRLRNSNNFFDEIFKKKYISKNNSNTNNITTLTKEIFPNENILIRIHSFLSSEIFQKLFIKVLFNDNNSLVNNNNNDIYNIFSLWIMLKDINNCLTQFNTQNDPLFFINKNFCKLTFNKENSNDLVFKSIKNVMFKKLIFGVIEKYLYFLNRKNNNEIDETQIFTQDYHKIYEILFKLEQSKIAEFIKNNIENEQNYLNQINSMNNSKEEINYYKNIQSIFINKGRYTCTIINK